MRRVICDAAPMTVGLWAANFVESRIRAFQPTGDRPFCLGLPTGGTPLEMYKHLVAKHQKGLLSFEHVMTFNLDEYVGLPPEHPQSYRSYMNQHFFRQVEIPSQNINLLNGNATDLQAECDRYETKIRELGGLDLCIGGVGEEGHIAFNEAGSPWDSSTHLEVLAESTRRANSRFFERDPAQVPEKALTMGMGTILAARELIILAKGERKAIAVQQAIEGTPSLRWPVSALQQHPRSILVCDLTASQGLSSPVHKLVLKT